MRQKKSPDQSPERWAGFRSVLCAIDFSDQSQRALHYALAVARRGRASLRVIYVNDPFLVTAAATALHDRSLARRSRNELQAFVAAAMGRQTAKGPRISAHVAVGSPAEQILKAARTFKSELVVLGTQGLTGAKRLLFGSTTLAVLQETTVPVLAIPRRIEAPQPALPPWPGRQVLAAIDLDDAAGRDVENAARIAAWFGPTVRLAHVVSKSAEPGWLMDASSANEQMRIAQAQQQLETLATIARRHTLTDLRVVHGDTADAIAALAAEDRAQLLITALRDRRH